MCYKKELELLRILSAPDAVIHDQGLGRKEIKERTTRQMPHSSAHQANLAS